MGVRGLRAGGRIAPRPLAPRQAGAGREVPPATLDLLRAGLVLGFTGFGGGLAVLTQVEHRLVGRERWITPEVFLESAALGQSLPGAISTNTLGFVGWRLARLRGALALEGGFVLPSFLMMVAFSLLYARLRQLAVVAGIFHLLNPAVAGMVGAMGMTLAAQLVRTPGGAPVGLGGLLRDPGALLVALGAALGVAVLGLGVPEVVLAAGLLGVARHLVRNSRATAALLLWSLGLGLATPRRDRRAWPHWASCTGSASWRPCFCAPGRSPSAGATSSSRYSRPSWCRGATGSPRRRSWTRWRSGRSPRGPS